jgi:hypothetical protein
MKAIALAPNVTPFTDRLGIGETKLNKALPAEAWPKPAWFNQRKGKIMSTTTLLILIVVLILVFGGGGGYYWRRGRGR